LWKWPLKDGGWDNPYFISSGFIILFAFQNLLTGISDHRNFEYFFIFVILLICISGFFYFLRNPFFLCGIYLLLGIGLLIGADDIGDFSGILYFIFAYRIYRNKSITFIILFLTFMALSLRFIYLPFVFSRAFNLIAVIIFSYCTYFILFELPEIKKIREKNTTAEINRNLKIIKYELSDQELFLLDYLAKGSLYKEMAWKITNEMDHEISENGVSRAISRLCKKFKVKNSCSLMVKCVELGLVSTESENSTM